MRVFALVLIFITSGEGKGSRGLHPLAALASRLPAIFPSAVACPSGAICYANDPLRGMKSQGLFMRHSVGGHGVALRPVANSNLYELC